MRSLYAVYKKILFYNRLLHVSQKFWSENEHLEHSLQEQKIHSSRINYF